MLRTCVWTCLLQFCSLPYLLLLLTFMFLALQSVETTPLAHKLAPSPDWEKYGLITGAQEQLSAQEESVPLSLEEPHLFTNYALSYDKRQDAQDAQEEKAKPSELKVWLSNKFNQLLNIDEEKKDEEEVSFETSDVTMAPRSASSSNRNEINLPIDFNLLLPQAQNDGHQFGPSSVHLNLSSLSLDDSQLLDEEEDGDHVLEDEQLQPPQASGFADFDTHSLDFVQQLIRQEERNASTLSEVTTNVAPIATTTAKAAFKRTLDYRNISYDLPERRFLMTYPVRRLLMAYFAPRILRFQMAMLLNSVIGEVSRKIFDPLIGNRFGFGGSNRQPTTSAPVMASPSLSNLAQSLSSLSSLPSLAALASSGILPPSLASAATAMAGAQSMAPKGGSPRLQSTPGQLNPPPPFYGNPAATASAAASGSSSSATDTASLASQLSSALSGPGGLAISPASMQTLLSSLGDSSEIKQLLALASSTSTAGQASNYQSNVDSDEEMADTDSGAVDLTPS